MLRPFFIYLFNRRPNNFQRQLVFPSPNQCCNRQLNKDIPSFTEKKMNPYMNADHRSEFLFTAACNGYFKIKIIFATKAKRNFIWLIKMNIVTIYNTLRIYFPSFVMITSKCYWLKFINYFQCKIFSMCLS